jgi:alpha-glucosidase
VGLVLWCVWCTLDRQREEFLSQLEAWGVKGVKVDFMDRDDQVIVDFYERMAKATAAHHLLLDFHGAFKPTGLRREYPNLITREGVAGMEQSKWSVMSDPEYCTAIPFIRMFAGPMDYTPGAMRNAQKDAFTANFDLPSSMGTRCHQLAMYTVYESPLQMLSDSPSAYDENPESRDFIAAMPVTWDETRALDGRAGDFVVVARRNGERWFLGAMTDWDAREVSVPLSFLGDGEWKAVVFEDGPEAAVDGTSHTRSERTVSAADTLTLKLAPGGGFAARFERP